MLTRAGSWAAPVGEHGVLAVARAAGVQTHHVRLRVLSSLSVAAAGIVLALAGSSAAAETGPYCMNAGWAVEALRPTPYAHMAGQVYRSAHEGKLFLVDPLGALREIPDRPTFDNLFRDGTVINTVSEGLDTIPRCRALSPGAILLRGQGSNGVYLMSDGRRYGIASPAAMDRYSLAWEKVLEAPAPVLAFFPEGFTWR